jgi:hypothetical protein
MSKEQLSVVTIIKLCPELRDILNPCYNKVDIVIDTAYTNTPPRVLKSTDLRSENSKEKCVHTET